MEDRKDPAAVRVTVKLPEGTTVASWARDANGNLVDERAKPETATQVLERQLAAKAKAPRVTLDQVDREMESAFYFTANEGVYGANLASDGRLPQTPAPVLGLLTICVLVLRNGFTVTGESACASPENFDAGVGQRLAREDAVRKVWKLLGYALRDKLHHAPAMGAAVAQLQVAAETCENNAPIHETEGNEIQAGLSRANAQSYRAAIKRLA